MTLRSFCFLLVAQMILKYVQMLHAYHKNFKTELPVLFIVLNQNISQVKSCWIFYHVITIFNSSRSLFFKCNSFITSELRI